VFKNNHAAPSSVRVSLAYAFVRMLAYHLALMQPWYTKHKTVQTLMQPASVEPEIRGQV